MNNKRGKQMKKELNDFSVIRVSYEFPSEIHTNTECIRCLSIKRKIKLTYIN